MNNIPTIPAPVRTSLTANDYLGFDTLGQCLGAIAQHDDWAERWDVVDYMSPSEIQAVNQYASLINQSLNNF